MITCHMFKCTRCGNELPGPEVKGQPAQAQKGRKFKYGNPVSCRNSPCPIIKPDIEYIGTGKRPPDAPPLPVAAPVSNIPKNWQAAGEGKYEPQMRYQHIPPAQQSALISELTALFEGQKIELLGAAFDRFDAYQDQLDDEIQPGLTPAPKHLTVPLVLERLDTVLGALTGSPINWGKTQLDRNFGAITVSLTLPKSIQHAGMTFKWSYESLNDLINPRAGHACAAADYGGALKKAIRLCSLGNAGETTRGTTSGYFLWSTTHSRGITVVLNRGNGNFITTIYYSGAATRWFAGSGAGEKVDRSV